MDNINLVGLSLHKNVLFSLKIYAFSICYFETAKMSHRRSCLYDLSCSHTGRVKGKVPSRAFRTSYAFAKYHGTFAINVFFSVVSNDSLRGF